MPSRATLAARPAGPSHRAERPGLHDLLAAHREEIQREILNRVTSISDPREVPDPRYAEGLREAVGVALDYALEALELGEAATPPPPPALLAQARLAARVGIGLDAVLLRYFAGYALLSEALVSHADPIRYPQAAAELAHHGGALLERLLSAVAEEYTQEASAAPASAARRRAELVDALLAGKLVDPGPLAYELEAWHIAVVASGPGCEPAVRELAAGLDRRLLLVGREAGVLWAWLGGRRALASAELAEAAATLPAGLTVCVGEPGEGLSGWRLTHRQAAAALAVAERGGEGVVRYGDVALLASVLRDEVLVTTLRRLYLDPLERARGGGRDALQTLAAYFRADRNVSSAAALLGVSRNTVNSRLRAVESAIGRPLSSCAAELDLALRIESLRDDH